MEKYLQKSISFILYFLLFAIPFFFFSQTQEYFVTNKFYLLGFGVLLLVLISTIQLFVSKKISWQKHPFDNLILLFLTTLTISTLFSSPNKVQALLNPSFGLVMMISLTILYFYISRSNPNKGGHGGPPLQILSVSSALLSLITIIFFFQPFKNINLPQNLAFFKNPLFTPVGSQLDLAIFLGFFVVFLVGRLLTMKQSSNETMKQKTFNYSLLTINLLALFLTVYSLLKPIQPIQPVQLIQPILPPFRLSWYAALEILKNPQTALIGIGPDNFSAIFTRVKDFAYNQSPLWQINSFNVSHSAILQIFTETGILGLLSFGLLIFNVFRQMIKKSDTGVINHAPTIYLLICLFILPTSFIVLFLFFLVLGLFSQQSNNETIKQSVNLSDILPIYIGIVAITFGLISVAGYFLGRSYASEYYFKKSLNGVTNNNLKEVYNNQRQAVILNPYIERFHSNFAQTNLLIANNLAQKDSKKITEQDRQTITQAIQAAIAEGKAVISLNPQKADGWQNLALIYLNVINTAKGADVWTISAYQRAILTDPQNPIYRVGLGEVYYSLKKYDDALNFFGQAVSLKPDWANANYNYAWANFQKKNYPQAVNAMQNTLSLINQKTNKTDYKKVQKELANFKKMLPKEASPEVK